MGAKLGLGRRRRRAGHPGRGRCAPGRAAAHCAVTARGAPRPRGDIHRPAGPGSAAAARAAHGSAAAGGPGHRAPLRSKLLWRSLGGRRAATAGGELRADGAGAEGGASRLRSRGVEGPPVSPASSVLSSRVSPGDLGGVPGEKGGDLESRSSQPRRRPGAGGAAAELWRSRLASQTSKKSLAPRVFGRVPQPPSGGVRLRRRREATPGRGLSLGDPSRVPSSAGSGCTKARGERRLRTSQPGGAGMPRPAGRCQPSCEARGPKGKRPLADEPLQLPNGPMSSLRSPSGSQTEPPSCGAESTGRSSQKCPCDSD